VVQLQVSNKEEELRNHETYAKGIIGKKGSYQATSINFATTHTFVFKLYKFFLLSREKVWIWEPFFFSL
jgi:hypothetical protein